MTKLSVALLLCCLARIAPAQSASDARSLLDSVVPAAMTAERIPGAVVSVVSGGRVIFSKGYGLADRDTRRPMTDSTIVRIGSIRSWPRCRQGGGDHTWSRRTSICPVGFKAVCTYPIYSDARHRCDEAEGNSIGRWYRSMLRVAFGACSLRAGR